jgi:hypothetical protein
MPARSCVYSTPWRSTDLVGVEASRRTFSVSARGAEHHLQIRRRIGIDGSKASFLDRSFCHSVYLPLFHNLRRKSSWSPSARSRSKVAWAVPPTPGKGRHAFRPQESGTGPGPCRSSLPEFVGPGFRRLSRRRNRGKPHTPFPARARATGRTRRARNPSRAHFASADPLLGFLSHRKCNLRSAVGIATARVLPSPALHGEGHRVRGRPAVL